MTEWIADAFLAAVIVGIASFTGIGALVFGGVAACMTVAGMYFSDMDGYAVLNFYFLMPAVFVVFPLQIEMGYYTNQIGGIPLNDWYYMPLFSTMPVYSPHICPWPWPLNDPPVSLLAYDDSTSSFFEGAPFYIDGYYVGTSSSIINIFCSNMLYGLR